MLEKWGPKRPALSRAGCCCVGQPCVLAVTAPAGEQLQPLGPLLLRCWLGRAPQSRTLRVCKQTAHPETFRGLSYSWEYLCSSWAGSPGILSVRSLKL